MKNFRELEQLQHTDPFHLFVSVQTKKLAQCSHRRRNAIASAPPRTQEQQMHEKHLQSPLSRKQEQQQPVTTAAVAVVAAVLAHRDGRHAVLPLRSGSMDPKLDLASAVTGSARP